MLTSTIIDHLLKLQALLQSLRCTLKGNTFLSSSWFPASCLATALVLLVLTHYSAHFAISEVTNPVVQQHQRSTSRKASRLKCHPLIHLQPRRANFHTVVPVSRRLSWDCDEMELERLMISADPIEASIARWVKKAAQIFEARVFTRLSVLERYLQRILSDIAKISEQLQLVSNVRNSNERIPHFGSEETIIASCDEPTPVLSTSAPSICDLEPPNTQRITQYQEIARYSPFFSPSFLIRSSSSYLSRWKEQTTLDELSDKFD